MCYLNMTGISVVLALFWLIAATVVFSSAADIVSGAYPMPSRPSSVGVVGVVVNFFSNRIGSFTFYPIFLIFGLNVYNNIVQKPV